MWIATMTASFHDPDRLGRIALLPAGVRHENRIQQPGFAEIVCLTEDTERASWFKEARAREFDVGAEWPTSWIPNAFGATCDGESLRIVQGEAGKEVHSGRHALQVKGGKNGFHTYQSETGQGPDGTYRCRFFGRGTGKLTLATYEYSNKLGSGCPGKPRRYRDLRTGSGMAGIRRHVQTFAQIRCHVQSCSRRAAGHGGDFGRFRILERVTEPVEHEATCPASNGRHRAT